MAKHACQAGGELVARRYLLQVVHAWRSVRVRRTTGNRLGPQLAMWLPLICPGILRPRR